MADRPPYPGMPRWVIVLGILGVLLILLLVTALVTGLGGEHGPGRHLPPGSTNDQTRPLEHDRRQP